jgi:DNA ligase-1
MATLPTLYRKARSGKIYSWNVWPEKDFVYVEHGTLDGKKQISSFQCEPKNLGKINSTTAEQQAILEAERLWKHQNDRNYSITVEDAEEQVFLPMLAYSLEKKKHKLKFPCHIQPKLDGVRCLAYREDDNIILLSRQGKQWNCPHIVKQLMEWLPDGDCCDGELYIHDPAISFQTITSWVKKYQMATQRVEYHIYDYPVINYNSDWGIWESRAEKIKTIPVSNNILQVQTYVCNDMEDIGKYHDLFVSDGYEGAIVRNIDGKYEFDHRSDNLLKVKTFIDSEYEIIGAEDGIGKFEGCVIWICIDNETDKTFRVVPKGSLQDKANWFKNKNKYIHKLLKVQFFEYTDDGLPRFPVGIGIRDPDDL